MLIAVINGIVINDIEPVLDSSVRQLVERSDPRGSCAWAACWLIALEMTAQYVGERTVKSILN